MTLKTLACLIITAAPALTADWPNWRGPEHTGITRETSFKSDWSGGAKVLWKAQVGAGYSSFAVVDGKAYTLGWADGKDHVTCLDAQTGKPVWVQSYPCPKFDKFHPGGTGSTPTVHEGRVYTVSKQGDLFCFDAAKGQVLWHKLLTQELGVKTPTWGFSGSPIVDNGRIIIDVGTVAAYDKAGKEIWRSADLPGSYCTPVGFEHSGRRLIATVNAQGLTILGAGDGKTVASHRWKTRYDVNAGTPIVSGDQIFISSGYGHGGALLKFTGSALEKVWENKEMKNQMNPSVLIDGFLYGFDGDQHQPATRLACVEFQTGKARWGQRGLGAGSLIASVAKGAAGEARLIALGENGELAVIAADPSAYKEIARTQVLGSTSWTCPVLSEGRIYCRNDKGDVVCLDVKP